MTWKHKYGIITLLILLLEIIIALYVHDNFIRPFFGDFLAVMLIYFFLRTFLKSKPNSIALSVFIFALCLEILQYVQILKLFSLEDYTILKIVLGSTFDWMDILAYILGTLCALIIDQKLFKV